MSEPPPNRTGERVLRSEQLVKRYHVGRSLGDAFRGRPAGEVRAVDGVDLELATGEVLALVGESGCGKSTMASMLLGLEPPTSGTVTVMGTDLHGLDRQAMIRLRRQVQVVFQDPYEALNPRQTVTEIVGEPLRIHRVASGDDADRLVADALRQAGLEPPELYGPRRPHELSGGQRQRVCIAAALVLEPRVLIADEPVSMLDVSNRAEILNLLQRLAREQGLAIVMITHDLSTVASYSDRLAVMYLGRIVETGPTTEVLRSARHPYTRALLSVVASLDPHARPSRTVLVGEPPDPTRTPAGCRFHTRCPIAVPACTEHDPRLQDVGPGHTAACLLIDREPPI